MNATQQIRFCQAIIFTMLLSGAAALAQSGAQLETGDLDTPVEPTYDDDRSPIRIVVGASQQLESSIDDGGDFRLTRLQAGIRLPIDLGDSITILTLARYELAEYDFKAVASPWGTIHTIAITPLLEWKIDENWSLLGGPSIRFSGEQDAETDQAITLGAMIGARYTVDEKFSIGFGLGIADEIEDDPRFVPVLMMMWRFADNWQLSLGFLDVTTTGLGAELGWAFADNFELTLGVHYHEQRFRLADDDNTNPDGVGEESGFNLFARLNWITSKTFTLQGFIGVMAGGELVVEDHTGSELLKSDYDPAPVAGVNGLFTF